MFIGLQLEKPKMSASISIFKWFYSPISFSHTVKMSFNLESIALTMVQKGNINPKWNGYTKEQKKKKKSFLALLTMLSTSASSSR